MKRLLMITLSTLILSGLAAPTLADELTAINSSSARKVNEISPFALVTGGYQGYFSDQGIPSSSRFTTAIRANKIQAEDLVKSAISRGRLSEDTLNNRAYLNHVRSLMESLDRD